MTVVKVLSANVLAPRWEKAGDSPWFKRLPLLVAIVKREAPALLLLQECFAAQTTQIMAALGEGWRSSQAGPNVILWDAQVTGSPAVRASKQLVGADDRTVLSVRWDGWSACCTHLTNGVDRSAQRNAQAREVAAWLPSGPLVVGGDLNSKRGPSETGSPRHSLAQAGLTMTTASGKGLDELATRGLEVTDRRLIDPGPASDHPWLVSTITVPATAPTDATIPPSTTTTEEPPMSLSDNVSFYERVMSTLGLWGWGPHLEYLPGWRERSNGKVGLPVATVHHHTGGTATATSYLLNPTDRPELIVLANVHVTRGHRIKLLAAGGASHAGMSNEGTWDLIRAGRAPLDRDLVPGADSATFSANRWSVGIETDGAGGSTEWDAWMYAANIAVAAACHEAGKWLKDGGNPRSGAHKELSRRKPGDPWANMGRLRTDVAAYLANPTPPPDVPAVALGSRPLSKTGNDRGDDVVQLIDLLIVRGYPLKNDGLFGPAVEAAVRDFQVRNGLTADGAVGPTTVTALLQERQPEPQPSPEPPVDLSALSAKVATAIRDLGALRDAQLAAIEQHAVVLGDLKAQLEAAVQA